MTTSLDIMDLVQAAIANAGTDAGQNVFRPGDWPTQSIQYPIIRMRVTLESRESLSNSGAPQFKVTATIRISGEVSEPAQVDDAAATIVEQKLWALKHQIDAAVINDFELFRSIEQIAATRSSLAYNADAAMHLGGIQIDMDVIFYQGADDFAQPETVEVDEIHMDLTNYSPTGITVSDLQQ